MKEPRQDLPVFPGYSKMLRIVLDILALFCVLTQTVLVVLVLLGSYGTELLPLAGGAVISMFLVTWFYARWLFPMLDTKHILAIIAIKELAIISVVALASGLVFAIEYFIIPQ